MVIYFYSNVFWLTDPADNHSLGKTYVNISLNENCILMQYSISNQSIYQLNHFHTSDTRIYSSGQKNSRFFYMQQNATEGKRKQDRNATESLMFCFVTAWSQRYNISCFAQHFLTFRLG